MILVIAVVILLLLFIAFALYCCICHPTSYDRESDDEQQMEFLRNYRKNRAVKGRE